MPELHEAGSYLRDGGLDPLVLHQLRHHRPAARGREGAGREVAMARGVRERARVKRKQKGDGWSGRDGEMDT